MLDNDRLVRAATLGVLAHTRPGKVEPAATKPRCPRQSSRGIEHGRPGRLPAEVEPTCRLVPKPLGLRECERQHVLIGLDPKVARERRRLRLVDRFGVRDPEVLAHAGILRAGRKVGCPKRDPGPLATQGGHDNRADVVSSPRSDACGARGVDWGEDTTSARLSCPPWNGVPEWIARHWRSGSARRRRPA